ncbi:28586_t:CDS:2, partial [Gigaspora margarita]
FEEGNNKGVVEVDKRIDHLFQIKQEQDEFVLMYAYYYEKQVIPIKHAIRDYKEIFWFIFELKNTEIDDESIDKKKSDTNTLDNSDTKIEKSKVKRKNKYEINNVKCYNELDEIKHGKRKDESCDNAIIEVNNRWLDDLKTEIDRFKEIRKEKATKMIKGEFEDKNKIGINNVIKIGDPKKMIKVIWMNDVDNSINIISILLNTYLRRTVKQSIEAGKYMKRIEGGTRTLEINSERKELKTINKSRKYAEDVEFLHSKSADYSMMKHQISMLNKDYNNVVKTKRLK